jgi:hypothetical protein
MQPRWGNLPDLGILCGEKGGEICKPCQIIYEEVPKAQENSTGIVCSRPNFHVKIFWKERNIPVFNPIANKCRLCLREKFNIIWRPSIATLDSRQDIFGYCRHLQRELICVAPD